jgi:polysaccharide biosynthesis protein PslE
MPKAGAGTKGSPARLARQAAQVRPRLSLLDVGVLLWRAKWLMGVIFLPILVAGMLIAFALPQTFVATSRLMVAPDAGTTGPAEAELLRSAVVAKATLADVKLPRAYPALARRCQPAMCERMGIAALTENLVVSSVPGSPVITARFAHGDAALSAEILNALVEDYLAYRINIFADTREGALLEARQRLEQDIAEAEQAIRTYLLTNNLTDIAAERETLLQLSQAARGELLAAQSGAREREAQLANYRRQIVSVPPEIDFFVEDSSQQTLLALQAEREEKLSRYRADSQAIKDLDARIAQAEANAALRKLRGGTVRRGPNPLYQQIEASIATLQSEVQALRSRAAELGNQIAAFDVRQRRLIELQPDLQELERQRESAEISLRAMSGREADDFGRQEQVRRHVASVRLVEPATVPLAGKSLKTAAAVLALVLATLAALAAGLVHALTRKGFATAGSAERTLGLHVLAAIRKY